MNVVFDFIICFGLIFVFEYLVIVKKNKDVNKDKLPKEVEYLISVYKVNIKKVNYPKFVRSFCLVNCFIISTIYVIVLYLLNNIFLQLIIGFVLLMLLTIICYGLLGKYYNRKERE